MDELYHHGILGQKWGRRRYQNVDGSLTAAGVEHYATLKRDNTTRLSENIDSYKKVSNSARNYRKELSKMTLKQYRKHLGLDDTDDLTVKSHLLENMEYESETAQRYAELARKYTTINNELMKMPLGALKSQRDYDNWIAGYYRFLSNGENQNGK